MRHDRGNLGQDPAFDARLKALARQDEACQRLMKVPGVGPVAAGAIRALAGDVTRFSNGRDFAAWLGLTPRQNSSGDYASAASPRQAIETSHPSGAGAVAVFRHASAHPDRTTPWAAALISVAAARGGCGNGRQDGQDHLGHAGARRGLPLALRHPGRVRR